MNYQKKYDDRQILRRCIRRDSGAWDTFITRYSSLIVRSIECRLRKHGFALPRHDIEDIRQGLLASIWEDRKLESVSHTKDITYWLAIVSGNFAMQHMRRHRLGRETALPIEPDRADLLMTGIGEGDREPGNELMQDEVRKQVRKAVKSLPHYEKIVIQLNIIHGKSYEEIAKMLRLPPGTVSSYIKRAKESLRFLLKDYL